MGENLGGLGGGEEYDQNILHKKKQSSSSELALLVSFSMEEESEAQRS